MNLHYDSWLQCMVYGPSRRCPWRCRIFSLTYQKGHLVAVTGFNHYNLRATREQMAVLLDFYTRVVGLTLGERPGLSSFGYWLYAGTKDVLHLSEVKEGVEPALNVQTTFDHVAFTCTDYAAMEQHLQAHGVQFGSRVVKATNVRQIFFKDPFGNGVEFNFDES